MPETKTKINQLTEKGLPKGEWDGMWGETYYKGYFKHKRHGYRNQLSGHFFSGYLRNTQTYYPGGRYYVDGNYIKFEHFDNGRIVRCKIMFE